MPGKPKYHLVTMTVKVTAPTTMTDRKAEKIVPMLEEDLEDYLSNTCAVLGDKYPELTFEVKI